MVLEEFLPRALSTNNYLRKNTVSISETGERVQTGGAACAEHFSTSAKYYYSIHVLHILINRLI